MITPLPYFIEKNLIEECIQNCPVDQERVDLNRPTGDFFYDAWILKEEYTDTCWERLLKTLPYEIGEARIIKLNPGQTYMSHADIDDRWHLNLTGKQSYLIDLDEKIMYLLDKDYKWYSMDAGRIHVATNFGSVDRYQLVIRQPLKRSNDKEFISIVIEPSKIQHDYRYRFDEIISPFLNKANKNLCLRNFKFNQETVSFELSMKELDNFKKNLTDDFKIYYT
jgi:hypothetical protein